MYMLVSIACMYCFCFVLCRCLYVCLYVSLYAGCEGAGSFAGARCSLAIIDICNIFQISRMHFFFSTGDVGVTLSAGHL